MTPSTERRAAFLGLVVGVATLAVVVAVRAASADDLDAFDQAKQALYVVDAWHEGRWLVPLEGGAIYPTKPPLMTWLSLAAVAVEGRVSEVATRLPSVLAGVLLIGATAWYARRLGALASVAAAVACATSVHVAKVVWLARTDALLAAFTTLAVGQTFASWEARGAPAVARRRLIAAAALAGVGTVAKSPVALACPAFALALFLASLRDASWVRVVGARTFLLAALVYAAIVGAWLVPAALHAGRPFVDRLWDELAGHTAGTGSYAAQEKARPSWYPLTHVAGKFLPWTVVLVAGVGIVTDPRPAVRYAACALAGSLLFFALLRVKRPDHVIPSYPWAAVLVGAQLAALGRSRATTLAVGAIGAGAIVAGLALPALLGARQLLPLVPERLLGHARHEGEPGRVLLAVEMRPATILALAAVAVPAGVLALHGARRRAAGAVVAGLGVTGALGCVAFFGALSPAVASGKARAVAAFGDEARALVGDRRVAFYRVPPSLCFYLERSQGAFTSTDDLERALASGTSCVVTDAVGAREVVSRRPGLAPAVASPFYWKSDAAWQLVLLLPAGEAPVADGSRGAGRLWW